MQTIWRALILVIAMSAPAWAPVQAAPAAEDRAAQLVAEARALHLAQDPVWLKLGRYERRGFFLGGVRSNIITASYFLSGEGRTDPEAELEATLSGLLQPAPVNPDDSVLCRFPARAMWLSRRLSADFGDALASCPGYSAWSGGGEVTGVNVLFVAGYLSNPGSVYGHLLLRFETGAPQDRSDLLETAINYGAAYSENDPMVLYVARGLTGGYHSTFSTLEFFFHNDRYRDLQLRDVWTYRLDLTPEEVALLVAHVWEVQKAQNHYYFLRQNCAYRIAELLTLVVDRDLIPKSKVWVTPIEVFHRLAEEKDGRSAIKGIERLPSRQAQFREGFARLPVSARRQLNAYARDEGATPTALMNGIDESVEVPLLDVALDYYAFAGEKNETKADFFRRRRHELVVARIRQDAPAAAQPRGPPAPHEGQRPSMAQLSPFDNDKLGNGIEMRIRPVYNDFLSNNAGSVPYSELSMADLRLVQTEEGLFLRQLEFVRVTALNVSATGLPGDSGMAWRMRFGLEARDLSCDDCTVAYLEAAGGKAFALGGRTVVYGLLGGRAQALENDDNYAQAIVTSGLITGAGRWKASLAGGLIQQLDGDQRSIGFGAVETRYHLSDKWDIGAGVEQREALEGRLGLSFFW